MHIKSAGNLGQNKNAGIAVAKSSDENVKMNQRQLGRYLRDIRASYGTN